MKFKLLATSLIVLSAACASTDSVADPEHKAITTEQLEVYECGSITRLHTFGGIFLASQPTPEDFEQAKKGGVVTVVNLRHEAEIIDFDEQVVVTELGLNYLPLAWNGPDELTDSVFDESRQIIETVERPALVHCGSANRVGAIWLPWRVLNEGVSVEEALAEAKMIGMRSPAYEQKALDYIKRKQM
ncbi:MAG: protein tyrosine phosphatase (PTP) superfamily phosphohydrolase (DUF442 family) [Planctomycetota bacterium]|jgi:protein tyrosine phosphatase (PTP) superfamily phosphohydrolase (DUF442 family)